MPDLTILRFASVLAIAFIYMMFDIFNKRNVPTIFAYATVAYGIILTVLYLNSALVLTSFAIASVIIVIGYIVYRMGQIGAADFLEFAAISLILPLQQSPILSNVSVQPALPFIFSILVNTGIVAIILVPIIYFGRIWKNRKSSRIKVGTGNILKAVTILCAYAIFAIFLYAIHASPIGIAIILIVGASTVAIMLMESNLTTAMVSYLSPKELQPEDMIAFNIMKKSDIARIKKRIKNFDALVTEKMLREFKEKGFEEKLPVYTNAMPLALPIFIGVVLAFLIGNLILFILPL